MEEMVAFLVAYSNWLADVFAWRQQNARAAWAEAPALPPVQAERPSCALEAELAGRAQAAEEALLLGMAMFPHLEPDYREWISRSVREKGGLRLIPEEKKHIAILQAGLPRLRDAVWVLAGEVQMDKMYWAVRCNLQDFYVLEKGLIAVQGGRDIPHLNKLIHPEPSWMLSSLIPYL